MCSPEGPELLTMLDSCFKHLTTGIFTCSTCPAGRIKHFSGGSVWILQPCTSWASTQLSWQPQLSLENRSKSLKHCWIQQPAPRMRHTWVPRCFLQRDGSNQPGKLAVNMGKSWLRLQRNGAWVGQGEVKKQLLLSWANSAFSAYRSDGGGVWLLIAAMPTVLHGMKWGKRTQKEQWRT